jgi:hypothetical protein
MHKRLAAALPSAPSLDAGLSLERRSNSLLHNKSASIEDTVPFGHDIWNRAPSAIMIFV